MIRMQIQLDERQSMLDLDVMPDWTEETLDLRGSIRAWVWPVQLVYLAVRTFIERDTRRMLRAARG